MMPGLDESDSSEYSETEETMGPTPDPELNEFVEVGRIGWYFLPWKI